MIIATKAAPRTYGDRARDLMDRIACRLGIDDVGMIRDPRTPREHELAATWDALCEATAPDDAERGTW